MCPLIRCQIRSEISSRLTSGQIYPPKRTPKTPKRKIGPPLVHVYGRDRLRGWSYDAARLFASVSPDRSARNAFIDEAVLSAHPLLHRHHHDTRFWDKGSFALSILALLHQRCRWPGCVENLASGFSERTQGLFLISAIAQIRQNRVEEGA